VERAYGVFRVVDTATSLKRLVKSALTRAGLEVRRTRRGGSSSAHGRTSLAGSLRQVKALGWTPTTCIDVGAAHGSGWRRSSRITRARR
jgi:hypothetical protein